MSLIETELFDHPNPAPSSPFVTPIRDLFFGRIDLLGSLPPPPPPPPLLVKIAGGGKRKKSHLLIQMCGKGTEPSWSFFYFLLDEELMSLLCFFLLKWK